MKKCNKCEIEDTDDKFKRNRNTCKLCISIQHKLWSNRNTYCDLLYKSYYIRETSTKKCTKCFLEKENIDFRKGNICKSCVSKSAKRRHKETYKSLKPLAGIDKECRLCGVLKETDQFHKHSRICKICEYDQWHDRESKRKKLDPIYRFKSSIRGRISIVFKRGGFSKKSHTFEVIGCSFEELKLYIESKFEPWMTWENRGLYNGSEKFGWDVDHIIPLSLARTEEEIIKLNHYTNLQPLCSKINRDIKKDNYYENKT